LVISKSELPRSDGCWIEIRMPSAQDEVAQAAIIYHLHVIGEATTRLSDELKDGHPEVGWSGWRGFRLVSTHFYETIDLERVEKQMQRALPLIAKAVEDEIARRRPPAEGL